MGKHDFLSPKAIGNRIKAKGLQKLRWFCQMCQKQCRDENGFKQHCTSEVHQRQMALFASNPEKFMDYFSEMFEEGFLELLSRRFGTRRVAANFVYNEYIQDKDHVHMNSTMWATLSDFVKYLGRTGQCEIEETEKGWLITWINRDPDAVKRAEIAAARRAREAAADAALEEEVDAIAAQARSLTGGADGTDSAGSSSAAASSILIRDNSEGAKLKLGINLGSLFRTGSSSAGGAGSRGGGSGGAAADESEEGEDDDGEGADASGTAGGATGSGGNAAAKAGVKRSRWDSGGGAGGSGAAAALFADDNDTDAPSAKRAAVDSSGGAAPASAARSNLQALMAEQEAAKASKAKQAASASSAPASTAASRHEDWLFPGLIVKVMNKKVGGGAYYKAKGVVTEVEDTFIGHVSILPSSDGTGGGDVLRLDQADCETVIPAVGGQLLILNGPHRGCKAELVTLHVDRYCADVRLLTGPNTGQLVPACEYEDICKIQT